MKLPTSEAFIEAMWSALIQSPDFKPMIEAWDKVLEDGEDSSQEHIQQLAEGMSAELARLEVALQDRAQMVKHDPTLLRDHVDSSIKLSKEQEIIQSSTAFDAMDLNVEALQAAISEIDFAQPGMQLVWGSSTKGNERFLLALTPLDAAKPLPKTYLVKSLETQWPAEYDAVLSRMFALSPAEIEVLKDLYMGFESGVIAERRGRSVHTVRTQIKSLMEKMGVNNQRRLIRMLSTLFQLDASADRPEVETEAEQEPFVRRTLKLSSEKLVEYCEYGDPTGTPLFLITPTINPVPSQFVADLAKSQSVRVISPFRPGSGLSSERGIDDDPSHIAHDYNAILKDLSIEKAQVVGCDSGGLYAAALASLLGSKRCSGLVQIGTGYPLSSMSQVMKMARSTRRTFFVARLSPALLYAPHRIAANDFLLSKEGEQRLVHFFFDGHKHDLDRVKADPFYYRAVQNLISYSFQSVDRLVHDVTYWANDWSKLVSDLPEDLPKLSIIGAENKNFSAKELESWCETNGWQCKVFDDEGQLLLFSRPNELLTEVLAQAPAVR